MLPWLAAAQVVEFATTFGGSGSDTVFAVGHHGGFTFVAGRTTSADFPVTDGSTYAGDSGEVGDIFVAKLDGQGQIVAATLLGGSGSDFANGLAITDGPGPEPSAKVITISGWTGSTNFRTLNPIQAANGGKTDAVIAQFDLNLNLLFSTYLGGAEDDQFSGLTPIVNFLGDDDLMFFGFTTSTDFPFPTPNAADPTTTVKNLTANADGLLVRMNRDRTVPMASLLRRTSSGNGTQNEVILAGTSGQTFPASFGTPAEYALYVTGWTDNDFFRHSSDPTGSGRRIFLTQIDPATGGRLYSRVLGGSGDDVGQAVAITAHGVVVLGQTTSPDLPNPRPLFQAGPGGGTDAVLVAWQHLPSNVPLFARPAYVAYLGGSGEDSGRALAAAFGPQSPQNTLAESLHFAGVTGSQNLPLPASPQHPPAQGTYGGGATDGFFGRLATQRNPESTGPALLLEARDLTFDGGPDDDAFTSVAAVQDNGTNFEGIAGGAVRVIVAEANRRIQRAGPPDKDDVERARLKKFRSPGGQPLLPDLTVLLVPRDPLEPNLEELVTLVITNKGLASATRIEVAIFRDRVDGAPSGEVVQVEYAGSVLEFDDEEEVFLLPRDVVLPPGQSLELKVTVKSLPAAGLGVPPGVGLIVDVSEDEEDAVPADNEDHFILPVVLSPDLAVELLSATQDSPAVTPRRARYEFRVSNAGTAVAENAEVVLTGMNLRNATYQLAGAAPVALGDLDGAGEQRIPVGSLAAGQNRNLVVEGEPARPNEGTGLTARGVAAGDANPENDNAPGETQPGPGPDYAVSIVSQTIGFEDRDNATILTLRTVANLTLTLPEGLSLDRVADAVLTTRHVGTGGVVTADPGNLGSCERLDALTTRCTFPPEAFFQADQPPGTPGVIRLEVREDMEIVLPPQGPKVSFSVEGDGQDPSQPNNFTEPDLSEKGAVSVTRTLVSARTVLIRPGLVRNLITQRLRVHNAGPGTVGDLRLRIFSRLQPLPEPAYAAFVQAPQVVAGAEAGVTVTVIDNEDTITIASLVPGAEVVLEFVDVLEVMGSGIVRLEAPEGGNLLIGGAVGDVSVFLPMVFPPLRLEEKIVDMVVRVTEQRIEIESRDGGRVPVRVTELQVWHNGDDSFSNPGPPVDDVVLTLRGSGVNLGGSLQRRFGSGGTASVVPVSGVTRPEAPANPNVLRVPLGRFEPGQTNRYVLRDDVAEPDSDGLLGLSGELNHPLLDVFPGNNVFSSDFEYLGFQSTLDYAVFIRDQSVTTFLDPTPSVPQTVFALRTRFECAISGGQGVEPLPRMRLDLSLGGPLLEARLVPKSPDIPAAPAAALQVQQDHPLSHQLTAEFAAEFARDYFVETVSRAPAAPYQIVADLMGDGEVPAAGNNNRATRTVEDDLENFADVVVTGQPLDSENPLLRFKEQVRTFFFVSNRSQTVAARNVRLILGDRYQNPLTGEPGSLVRTVRIIGDNLPSATADCLRAGTGGDCVLGEIPPGGQVSVVVDTRFEILPTDEANHPFQILLDFRAQADNEVNYFNNDQTVTYPTRIPVVDIEEVVREGDTLNVRFRVLRPSAVPTDGVVLECADSLLGPWIPCTPPLSVSDDTKFIRPRGY